MTLQRTFAGTATEQRGLNLGNPAPEPRPWTEKYRPARLSDLIGQGFARHQLERFLESPYSVAFLFAGPTGTGKTSTARALASELGVCPHWGLTQIGSGEMDAEAVRAALDQLRFIAPGGGWKMVVADEADAMSLKAKQLWLSALESIPARSVLVFTTNHADRLESRFRDRCERIPFEAPAAIAMRDARMLAERIWRAEFPSRACPDLSGWPDLEEGGQLSYRRLVQRLQLVARTVELVVPPVEPVAPVAAAPEPDAPPAGYPLAPSAAAPGDSPRRLAALKAAATRRARMIFGRPAES